MFVFPTSAANAEVITALVVRITFDAAGQARVVPADGPASEVRPKSRSWSGSGLVHVGQLRAVLLQPPSARRTIAPYGDNATFTNSLRGRGPLVTWRFNCIVRVSARSGGSVVGRAPGTELAAFYLANVREKKPQHAVPAASPGRMFRAQAVGSHSFLPHALHHAVVRVALSAVHRIGLRRCDRPGHAH